MNTSTSNATPALPSAGAIWIKLAVVYLIIGVSLGIMMGVKEDFTLRPVHAHLNLLGWATLAIAGLIYSVFPQAGQSRLAKIQFWLQNLALPVMMIALTFLLLGNKAVIPALAIAEIATAVAVILFIVNVFKNVK